MCRYVPKSNPKTWLNVQNKEQYWHIGNLFYHCFVEHKKHQIQSFSIKFICIPAFILCIIYWHKIAVNYRRLTAVFYNNNISTSINLLKSSKTHKCITDMFSEYVCIIFAYISTNNILKKKEWYKSWNSLFNIEIIIHIAGFNTDLRTNDTCYLLLI